MFLIQSCSLYGDMEKRMAPMILNILGMFYLLGVLLPISVAF